MSYHFHQHLTKAFRERTMWNVPHAKEGADVTQLIVACQSSARVRNHMYTCVQRARMRSTVHTRRVWREALSVTRPHPLAAVPRHGCATS